METRICITDEYTDFLRENAKYQIKEDTDVDIFYSSFDSNDVIKFFEENIEYYKEFLKDKEKIFEEIHFDI